MYEFDLKLGATVFCTDGKCGQLAKYVLDPETQALRNLIVEKGFLLKEARVFPIALVERVTADGIELNLASREVAQHPNYELKTVAQPVTGGGTAIHADAYGTVAAGPRTGTVSERVHEGVSPTLTVVDRNTKVAGLDDTIGSLTHVVVAPESGAIRRLVVKRGTLRTSLLAIPGALLQQVAEEQLRVDVNGRDLEALPEYKPRAQEVGTRSPQLPD